MFYNNETILDHILGMTSEYDRDKGVYLYNRVNDDAVTYAGAAALVDFTTMHLAAVDGRDDVRRLLRFVDGANDYDNDHCDYLFSGWAFDLLGKCDD